MDEPISSLDANLRTPMHAEIKWRQRQLGTTTLYVTHNQIEAMSMTDRVAVLEAGRIQQVTRPMDIYNSPTNLFAAGFIGSPSMNLIPCQLSTDDDSLLVRLVGGLEITVSDPRIVQILKDSAREACLVLGTHPENVPVSPEKTPGSTTAEVYSSEPLGAETIIELMIGKDEHGADLILKARTASNLKFAIGQMLRMTFVSDRLHFLNHTTGLAIC